MATYAVHTGQTADCKVSTCRKRESPHLGPRDLAPAALAAGEDSCRLVRAHGQQAGAVGGPAHVDDRAAVPAAHRARDPASRVSCSCVCAGRHT